MKTVSSGFKTMLSSNQALLKCDLYTITLANGTVLRYTDCEQNITLGGSGGTLAQQQAAANAAALADIAAGGTDFYAEIGPASGSILWNNGGVGYGGGTVVASTPVAYASVTKTLSACVALTQFAGTISATNYKLLCMSKGYDWMQGNHCLTGDNVHTCAITPYTTGPLTGKTYTSYDSAHDGVFSYDSGGWQYLFDQVLSGTSGLNTTTLANLYISQFSLTAGTLACTSPMPAGGARSTGNVLRKIAQQICTGTGGGAAMKAHLQDATFAPVVSTNVNNGPSAGVYTSPAPVNVPMHYKSGLWIQDSSGDYFMAGSAGTVVWIKSDFSMYGMVVRNGGTIDGALSMQTMWAIRDAFLTAGTTFTSSGEGGTVPGVQRGTIRMELGLQAATIEVDLLYNQNTLIGGMTPGAFANAGGFDFATVQVDKLLTTDFNDTSNGVVNTYIGVVSDVQVKGGKVALSVAANTIYLQGSFPRNYALPQCNHALFDAGCTLNKASYAVNDAVDSATSTTVTAASLTQASGYFALGYITFTSGALVGLTRFVKSFASGVLTLLYPMPTIPSAGDTFTVYPGCDKLQNTCSTKFSNAAHFRGFPYVPTPEVLELGQAGSPPNDSSGGGAGLSNSGGGGAPRGSGGQIGNFKLE